MRLPAFTRQDAWVYGSLLFALSGGVTLVSIPFLQWHWMSTGMRSRIRAGQSMRDVLTAAEDALAAQGVLKNGSFYVLTAHCDDRSWFFERRARLDGSAEFRIDATAPDADLGSAMDDARGFAEANANGCAMVIHPGSIHFNVGDDGRVAELRPLDE